MRRLRIRPMEMVLVGAFAVSGCASAEEAVVSAVTPNHTWTAHLTGSQEVAGGDPDGTATATVTVSDNLDQICYDVKDIRNIGTVTMAHIHSGAMGVNGPPVLTLKVANEGGFKGCDTAPEWLQNAIKTNFTGYYVNIHTTDYPNGAIRGQLGS